MALVRQLKTTVFTPKSRYEYIVHRLKKCGGNIFGVNFCTGNFYGDVAEDSYKM